MDVRVTSDNFAVKFPPDQQVGLVEQEIQRLAHVDPRSLQPAVSESARDELKFAECLPVELADRVIQERLGDPAAVSATLARPTRIVLADQDRVVHFWVASCRR